MEYNSQRPHLIISEYGRHIQRMIDHTCEIADREERNKMARYIISVMGQLNPHLRDVSDFKHKLWDHLFMMSDFRLDVDSPYPIPSRESFQTKPDRIPYPNAKIRFRHYGKIIEKVIEEAKKVEEGPVREALIGAIAYNLKKSYLTWNRDSVQDDQIFKDLKELSGGTLQPAEGSTMTVVAEGVPQNYPQQAGKKFNRGRQKQKNFKRKFGGGTSF
jgi:hypothetical protein